jgi:hypothetical protein
MRASTTLSTGEAKSAVGRLHRRPATRALAVAALALAAAAVAAPEMLAPVAAAAGWAPDPAEVRVDRRAERAARHAEENAWALHQETTLAKTFTLTAAAGRRTVEIENFNGRIAVHGGGAAAAGGGTVTVTVRQSWSADAAAKIVEAQRAVRMEASQPGGGLRLYVNGPFRSHDGGIDFHGWKSVGYEARFDFDVEVPAGVDVVAKTVQGGDVVAADLGAHFEVANVNGGVTLQGISGTGSAHTVNGAIHAAFNRNPGDGCSFKTINGQIDVSLRSGLAADLRFSTINGEVYTDFPYSLRDLPASGSDSTDGRRPARYHYKSRGDFAARIGAGGPELAFSTINGNILIHRQDA